MVTLYQKKAGTKKYKKVRAFRTYAKCYEYVCEMLIKADHRLYYSFNLQHLREAYTTRKIFPFASHSITRRGISYKIKI